MSGKERDTVRKTKIVATIGPKSSSPQMISGLHKVGVSAFRLNCSHIETADLPAAIRDVRKNAPGAAVLVDIRGPKMRYGGPDRDLQKGSVVSLSMTDLGLGHGVDAALVDCPTVRSVVALGMGWTRSLRQISALPWRIYIKLWPE